MTQQASSPFTNSSEAAFTGLGIPLVAVYDVSNLTGSGTITLTFPQAITKAQVRIKSTGVNPATTIAIGNPTVTDGVNTVRVGNQSYAVTAAGQNFDLNFDFYTDLQATSLSIPVTLGGGTTVATLNTEVFANP